MPIGETGEIVVTHLATRDFPFIRYRTGDIGALGSDTCACGRGLPVLSRLEGRSTDFIVARDGTVMHGLALIYTLRDIPQIDAFKILQVSIDLTRVLVVSRAGLDSDIHHRIINDFRARLGRDVEIRIEQVDDIPPERSGKYRYVVSHVATPNTQP